MMAEIIDVVNLSLVETDFTYFKTDLKIGQKDLRFSCKLQSKLQSL